MFDPSNDSAVVVLLVFCVKYFWPRRYLPLFLVIKDCHVTKKERMGGEEGGGDIDLGCKLVTDVVREEGLKRLFALFR